MPVIIDGTNGINAAAVTTTTWSPTNLVTPGNSTLGDAASDTVTVNAGVTTFAASGARIKGDMSSTTFANRLAFQSSTTNGSTTIGALPNGTSSASNFQAHSAADPTNSSVALFGTNGSEVFVQSLIRGTGTYLPMTFYTSGSERMRIGSSGGVSISGGPLTVGAISGEGGEIQLASTGGGNGFMLDVDSSDTARLIQNSNKPMTFATNSAERLRIDASGRILIGSGANSSLGTVAANLQVNDSRISIVSTSGGNMGGLAPVSSLRNSIAIEADPDNVLAGSDISLSIDGSVKALLNASGNLIVGNSTAPAGKIEAWTTTDKDGLVLSYGATPVSGRGAGITFKSWTNNSTIQTMSRIANYMRDGTDNSYGSDLAFYTTNGSVMGERIRIKADGAVGLNNQSAGPDSSVRLHVTGTNNGGALLLDLLGDSQTSTRMSSSGVNNMLILRSAFGPSPESVNSAGARWGIVFQGASGYLGTQYPYMPVVDSINTGKAAAIYAVSEDPGAGYNRRVGLGFYTSGMDASAVSERIRISADGLVGINNSTPAAQLCIGTGITTNVSTGGYQLTVNSSYGNPVEFRAAGTGYGGAGPLVLSGDRDANTGWYFLQGKANCASGATPTTNLIIYANGNIQNTNNSYGAISDIKLKENIVDATPKLENILKLRIVNFNLIDDQSKTKQIGVIAQEVEEVFPGVVETVQDHTDQGEMLDTYTKNVKYSVFVPMLIKAMQEQHVIIEELRARIVQLEAK